jgi:prepilin-type N-terminal cleavage/methylation domain-containing protein
MREQRGFSLIELLIVAAIILIIAAIAIPNLLRDRIAANESSSVSSIRTINTAEVTYLTAYPTVGYWATFVALGPGAVVAPATTNVTYGVGSAPLVFNQTGVQRFCSEENGVLHFDKTRPGLRREPPPVLRPAPGLHM